MISEKIPVNGAIMWLLATDAKKFLQAETKYASNLNGNKFSDLVWHYKMPTVKPVIVSDCKLMENSSQ